jgi:hypothetical protein
MLVAFHSHTTTDMLNLILQHFAVHLKTRFCFYYTLSSIYGKPVVFVFLLHHLDLDCKVARHILLSQQNSNNLSSLNNINFQDFQELNFENQ